MKPQANVVADISPQGRVISSEIQKSVFNRSYHAFIFVLLGFGCLMGYTISQNYETQKDLQELRKEYDLNNLLRMKQLTESKNNVRKIVPKRNNLSGKSTG